MLPLFAASATERAADGWCFTFCLVLMLACVGAVAIYRLLKQGE